MKLIQNMRIRTRLTLGFGLCIIFALLLAVTGIIALRTVNDNYLYIADGPQQRMEALLHAKTNFMAMRYRTANFVMNSGDSDMINNTLLPQYQSAKASLDENVNHYEKYNLSDTRREQSVIDENSKNIAALKSMLVQFEDLAKKTYDIALTGNAKEADDLLKSAIPLAGDINALIETMLTPAVEYRTELSDKTLVDANAVMLLLAVFAAVLLIIAILLTILISKSIITPVAVLGKAAKGIASGNLDLDLRTNARDELGDLTRYLGSAVDTINSLVDDMDTMAIGLMSGDLKSSVHADKYEGVYKTVAHNVNDMAGGLISETLMFIECVSEFANGNFDAQIKQLPKDKAVVNTTIETVRKNLKSIIADIGNLVGEATKGNLSQRADASHCSGQWADILNELNKLMKAVSEPIFEAEKVLAMVAQGDFDSLVSGNYEGEFNEIKKSINNTVTNVDSYIDEISHVLAAMASDDFDQHISRPYVGKFTQIKDAINSIIDKFNMVMTDIGNAAEQVAHGAKQISQSSMTLASGASEQASSIEQLNGTIATINESTIENAINANEARELSNNSKENAANGDEDMKNMLSSMDGIRESSRSISNIIKVIDDIAFQTNMLALNAAVEAARAGEHGKGFAVVAEEVRSLAGRSQQAARETSALIEESINRVEDGTKIAALTAEALHKIVEDVDQVANIIESIAVASEEQKLAVNDVSDGLSRITGVVQDNSSTSEETASASQELSGQSDVLQSLISRFKLKK